MPSVSHSEVDSYLLCRRKWYYGYALSLERKSTSSSLALGSAVHKILESFYRVILEAGDDTNLQMKAFPKAEEAARAAYDEIVAGGFEDADRNATLEDIIFKWYVNHEPFVKEGWRILAVEKEFVLEYDTELELRYPFIIDLIALDPDGKTVVIDHKTTWDFYTEEASQLQPQVPKYIGGLRALGYKIDYGYYNELRTRLIKGTKSSKGVYPGPKLDQMLGHLVLKPNGTRVVTTFTEQIETSKEIQALKSLPIEEVSKKSFRVANKMVCQSCSFRDICTSELNGGNTKLMMKTEYKIRERKKFTTTSEDVEEPS